MLLKSSMATYFKRAHWKYLKQAPGLQEAQLAFKVSKMLFAVLPYSLGRIPAWSFLLS